MPPTASFGYRYQPAQQLSPSPFINAFADVVSWEQATMYNNPSTDMTSSSSSIHQEQQQLMTLSRPERALLVSAEERPLEYLLTDANETFCYVRILLKALDQAVSSTSSPLTSDSHSYESSSPSSILSATTNFPLDYHPPLDHPEALEVLHQDPQGVVVQYLLSKLYEVITLVLERRQQLQLQQQQQQNSSKTTTMTPTTDLRTLFYKRQLLDEDYNFSSASSSPIPELLEDWRPLLRILYRTKGDAFSKRTASLCLAHIFVVGLSNTDEPASTACHQPTIEQQDHCDESGTKVVEALQSLISWLMSRLQSSHQQSQQQTQASHLGIVTPTLVLLASYGPQTRRMLDEAGAIGYWTRHLRHAKRSRSSDKNFSSDICTSSPTLRRQPAAVSPPSFNSIASLMMLPPLEAQQSQSSIDDEKNDTTSSPRAVGGDDFYSLSALSNKMMSTMMVTTAAATTYSDTVVSSKKQNSVTEMTGASDSSSTELSLQKIVRSASLSSGGVSVQQIYELVFCLWTMTFDCPASEYVVKHLSRDGVVPVLAKLLVTAPREKILRLAIASLRQLTCVSLLVEEMISCGVHNSVERMLSDNKQWRDEDLVKDLQNLQQSLQENYREMTKWEIYEAQLKTGRLERGVLHTTEFFREHAMKMEGKNGDFGPVKRLVQLLFRTIQNSTVESAEFDAEEEEERLSVCLFDIGEFGRHYPNGKFVLQRLGAKSLAMRLIDHHDQDVRIQALTCVSILLMKNWRAVSRGPAVQ